MLSLHQLLPASPSYITVQERWPEIRHYFSQLSSYSADAEGKREEREREREDLIISVWRQPMNANEPWPTSLTHSVTYTHQRPRNLCHSSYCCTSLSSHSQCAHICAQTAAHHLQMFYLHHCCGQSSVTAIDTSHLTKAADHERSMALMKTAKRMWASLSCCWDVHRLG